MERVQLQQSIISYNKYILCHEHPTVEILKYLLNQLFLKLNIVYAPKYGFEKEALKNFACMLAEKKKN